MDHLSYLLFSNYGFVSVEHLGPTELPPAEGREAGVRATQFRYTWRPARNIRRRLSPGFCIQFDCYVSNDGLRRFVPVGDSGAFIHNGFLAGLAILTRDDETYRRYYYSYCGMRLVFNAVRRMKEHLQREFRVIRDLYVRPSGRESNDEWTVLPKDVGVKTIKELVGIGRDAARAQSILKPTKQQSIHYGLVEQAKRKPLHAESRTQQSLVRMALFDLPPGEKPPRRVVNIVMDRVLHAVDQHQDDTNEPFERWMSGPNNNFLKTIADQPRSRGGRLDREVTRRAILDLGWRAYSYVGQCLGHFAAHFLEAISRELSPAEQRLFEEVFLPRPYLGGLPLLLLMERRSFLGSAVTDIWTKPGNRERIRVLQRMLAYYAEMASRRRDADRRFKPKGSSKGTDRKTAQRLGDRDRGVAATANSQSPLEEIVESLRSDRNLSSRCRCGPPKVEVLTADPQAHRLVKIHCRCECGKIDDEMEVSIPAMKKAAAKLGIDLAECAIS